MFKVNPNNTVKRNVTVYSPGDGDKMIKGTLVAELKVVPQEELETLLSQPESALLDRVLVAVYGVGDLNGDELDASEALAAVRADSSASSAIAGEYLDMTKGVPFRGGKPRR